MRRATPTEHQEQVAFVQWCRTSSLHPGLRYVFAIPNGAKRSFALANYLRAEGVLSGIPDLFIPVVTPRSSGLFIEMKVATGGKLSPAQKECLAALTKLGYTCVIAPGCDFAIKSTTQYIQSIDEQAKSTQSRSPDNRRNPDGKP